MCVLKPILSEITGKSYIFKFIEGFLKLLLFFITSSL